MSSVYTSGSPIDHLKLTLIEEDLSQGKLKLMLGSHAIDIIQIKMDGEVVDLTGKDLARLAEHIQELYKGEITNARSALTLRRELILAPASASASHRSLKANRLAKVIATVENRDVTKVKKGSDENDDLKSTAKSIHDLLFPEKRSSFASHGTQAESSREVHSRSAAPSSRHAAADLAVFSDRVSALAARVDGLSDTIHTSALDQSRAAVAALRGDLEGTRAQLQIVQISLASAEADLSIASALKSRLENHIAGRDREIKDLEAEVRQLEENGEDVGEQLSATLSTLREERSQFVSQLSNQEAYIVSLEGFLRHLQGQFQTRLSESTPIADVITALHESIVAEIEKGRGLEETVLDLESALDQSQQTIMAQMQGIEELREGIRLLAKEKADLEDAVNSSFGSLDSAIEGNRAQLVEVIRKNAVHSSDLNGLDSWSLDRIKGELNRIIESLNSKVKLLEQRLDVSTEALKASRSEIAELQQQKDGLIEEVHRVVAENKAKDLEINAHGINLAAQAASIATHLAQASSYKATISQLQRALDAAETAGGVSEEAQKTLELELGRLVAALDAVNVLLDSLCETFGCDSKENLPAAISRLQEGLAAFQRENGDLKGELEGVRAEIDAAMVANAALHADLDAALVKLQSSDSSYSASERVAQEALIAELRASIASRLEEITQLQDSERTLQSQRRALYEELEAVVATALSSDKLLSDQNNRLMEQLAANKSELAAQRAILGEQDSRIAQLMAEAAASSEVVSGLRGELARAKASDSAIQAGLAVQLATAQSRYNDVNGRLQAACKALGVGGDDPASAISSLKERLADIEEENKSIQATLASESLAKSTAVLERDGLVSRLAETVQAHAAALAQLEAGHASASAESAARQAAEIAAFGEALNSKYGEIGQLGSTITDLRGKFARVTEELAGLRATMESLGAQLSAAEGQVEELTEANESLKAQLLAASGTNQRLLEENKRLSKGKAGLTRENATLAGRVSVLEQQLAGQDGNLSQLHAALVETAVRAQAAAAKALEAQAEAEALRRELDQRIVPVVVNLAEPSQHGDYDVSALRERIGDSPSSTAAAAEADVRRASQVRAEKLVEIIRAIPQLVADGRVEALTSDEVARDTDLYAAALDRIISYRGFEGHERLILNLMLVVASHRKDLVSTQCEDFLAGLLSTSEDPLIQSRVQQIASTLSDKPGWFSQGVSAKATGFTKVLIPRGASHLGEALSVCTRLDQKLQPTLSEPDLSLLGHDRELIKREVKGAIKTYLSRLGFEISDEGVDDLVKYIRDKGQFPPAITNYLSNPEGNGSSYQEPLARMLYIYTSCSAPHSKRFDSVASLRELNWLLGEDSSGDEKSKILLLFIKGVKGIAFTHKQALWGSQVADVMDGRITDPINAPGGAGKTRTVRDFMKLLSDIKDSADPMIFISPFAQEAEGEKIINKMIPEPTGRNEIFISMGDMSLEQMKKAKVVIDECHIIRPEMDIFLVNDGGEKVPVSKYLQLTASPLTVGYNLTGAIGHSLEAIQAEKSRLSALLDSLGAFDEKKERKIIAIREIFESGDDVVKLQAAAALHPPVLARLEAWLVDYSSFNAAPSDAVWVKLENDLKNVLGGLLVDDFSGAKGATSTGSGILGNTFCVNFFPTQVGIAGKTGKTERDVLRRLERLAFELDPVKGGPYKDSTTTIDRKHAPKAVVSVRIDDISTRVDRTYLKHIEQKCLANPKVAKSRDITRAIEALDREEEALRLLHQKCEQLRSLEIYKETKQRREKALTDMEVRPSDLLNWGEEGCIGAVRGALSGVEREHSKRVQMIFPGLRFNENILVQLTQELRPDEGNRVFIYHDSETGSEHYGEDRCIIVSSWGQSSTISLEEYQSQISQRDRMITFDDIGRCTDQIIMLYDDTNKQGGDFGIFSQANLDERATISQLLFLNIGKEGVDPATKLSSGDLYQSYCRRRRNKDADDIPPLRVFAPINAPAEITPKVLEKLPLDMLSGALRGQLISGSLTAALLDFDAANGDRSAIAALFDRTGVRLDTNKALLISALENKQAEIEQFFQRTKAIEHIAQYFSEIATEVQGHATLNDKMSLSGSSLSDLLGRVRWLQDGQRAAISSKLVEIRAMADRVDLLFQEVRESNRPREITRSGVASAGTGFAADDASDTSSVYSTPQKPEGRVGGTSSVSRTAGRAAGSNAPSSSKTGKPAASASSGAARASVAGASSASRPAQAPLASHSFVQVPSQTQFVHDYEVAIRALDKINLIRAYLDQSGLESSDRSVK